MKITYKQQRGYSVLAILMLVVVVVIGYSVISHMITRKASANKVEREISSIQLPAGVTLQDKVCGLGDAVDQGSGNCTFTYSATNLQSGYAALKQSLQALGMTGATSTGTVFYFTGGNPKLSGQLGSYSDTNQLKIFAELSK